MKTGYQKEICTPMLTAASFTIANIWQQFKCLSISEWIKKMWYVYTKEYYPAMRKKEILL